jgi:hypothetical protein
MALYRSATFFKSITAVSVAPAYGAATRLQPICASISISRCNCSSPFPRSLSSFTIHFANPIAPSTLIPKSSSLLFASFWVPPLLK